MKTAKEVVKQYIAEFEEKYKCKVLYVTLSGSKLYGTDTPNSDMDFKGIFVPTKEQVLLKQDIDHYVRDTNNSKEKNTKDDIDFSLHSLYKFFNLLEKSETGSIDVLFSMFREDTIIYQDKDFVNLMKENYKHFLNKNMSAFIGYALGQSKRFGVKGARYDELNSFVGLLRNFSEEEKQMKLSSFFEYIRNITYDYKYIKFTEAPGPKRESKELETYISVLGKLFHGNVTLGYFLERITKLYNQFGNRAKTISKTKTKTDFKALSHALRIAQEVRELLKTGFIKFPLDNRDELRDIKSGNAEAQEVIDKVRDILDAVDTLLLESDLPENSNREVMNKLLLELLV